MRNRERAGAATNLLELSHRQMLDILESFTDPFFSLDSQCRFIYANARCEKLFRRSRFDLIGHNILEEFSWPGNTFARWARQAVKNRQQVLFEQYLPWAKAWCEFVLYPWTGGLSAHVRDVTVEREAQEALSRERLQLEKRVARRTAELRRTVARLEAAVFERARSEQTLKENQRRLRALASQLTHAEHRERRRLAQVLHDHLQQILVGANLQLAELTQSTNEATRERASHISALIVDALHATRSLTCELSPPVLHEGGLVAGLNWLVDWMQEKYKLRVQLTIHHELDPLGEELRVLVFQAVRELLFNVVKHAGVPLAQVQARRMARELQVTVKDLGAGFATRAGKGNHSGFGLFSIQERLELMGGRLEIRSVPGKGSRFQLVVPVGQAKSTG